MVELGTLTRAAEHLGIAQPSLSQQVMDLEAHFKAKLLVRTKRGVTPTLAGELLYRHAHIILRQLEQATTELRAANTDLSGAVTVGLPGTIAPVLSMPLLRQAREKYPGIILRIVEGSYVLMNELTVNGRLDLALSSGESVRGVKSEHLLTDELVLVSSRELARDLPQGTVSIPELVGHPLVLPTRLGLGRSSVYEGFAQHGLTPTVVGELESAYEMISAARESMGSLVIGWIAAVNLAPDLVVHRLNNPTIHRPIYLSEPEILPPTASLKAIRTLITDTVRGMVGRGEWPGAVTPAIAGPLAGPMTPER